MSKVASKFEIQGHRGARGLMPENTIEAFLKALELGVDVLEMDVVMSADGVVVVSHEPHFNPYISLHPAGGEIERMQHNNLYMMPYSTIRAFDVGSKGNPNFEQQAKFYAYKPSLEEVIQKTQQWAIEKSFGVVKYNIEVKSMEAEYGITQPFPAEFCEHVLAVTNRLVHASNLVLQSFDLNILRYLYQKNKENASAKYEISLLIEPFENNDIDFNLDKLGFIPDIWSPDFEKLNASKVVDLHRLGMKVIPWTVNTVPDMIRVKEMGCDGLITDFPDVALNFF
jgi:glycerophosphoryl diester phosphodiesterase